MVKALLRIHLLLFMLTCGQVFAQESLQGGCDIIFSLEGNDTVCSNSAPFFLPDAFPFGGVYSGEGVSSNSFDPSVAGVGQFEITYTYIDQNCNSSASVIITVIEGQDLDLIGDFVICEGESTIIASGDGQEYAWYDGSRTAFLTFTPTETMTTFATGTNSEGCSVTTEFTITVGTVPDAFVTGETLLCVGDTAHLTVEGATSWQWSTGSFDESIDVIISAPETIELTIFGDNCDSTIAIYVSVLPFPDLSVNGPELVCQGDTVLIVASGADTYKSFLGYFDGEFSFVATSSASFVVEGFNENGCGTAVEFSIEVGVNTPILLSEVVELCTGQSQTLIAEGTEEFLWENLDDNTVISEGTHPSLDFAPEFTTNYRVTGVNAQGCGESIDFSIIVHPIPELSVESLNPICFGKVTTLQASGALNYLWNESVSDNPYVFIAAENETIMLTGFSEFGCVSQIGYDVLVNPVPISVITGSSNICQGESSTLTASGAESYEWSTGDATESVVVYPMEDSLFIVTGSNQYGCTDFTTFTVHVRPSPSVILQGPDTICAGQLFHLSVETNGDFTWSDGSTESYIEFTAMNDSTVSVSSQGANGCVNTQYFTVVINPLPQLSINGLNEICAQETITLTVSGGVSYEWGNGDETESIDVTPMTTTNYHVFGLGENGCVMEFVYSVIVHQLPYVYFHFNQDSICDLGPTITWQANPAGGAYSGDGVVNNQFDPFSAIVGNNETSYTVTDANKCSATSTDVLYVDDCSGVEENSGITLRIYPNPAEDQINIESVNGRISGVLVFNGMGELVLDHQTKSEATKFTLETASLSSGIYELRFRTSDGAIMSRKIIIR